MLSSSLGSFFSGGFECSSQRRRDGTRLNLTVTTGHRAECDQDYRLLASHGMKVARDGFCWPEIERRPGRYDWSFMLPLAEAADRHKVQAIWDLCHYGWPGWIDIWSPDFVRRFSEFAAGAAAFVSDVSDGPAWFCPINEISYWAWAGGEVAQMNPFAARRGGELKRQLVRASLAAIAAIRQAIPDAKIISAEPLINVVARSDREADIVAAEAYRMSQFESVNLLLGDIERDLGGHSTVLDVIGLNFYPQNQWELGGTTIPLGHHRYKPLSAMLVEAYHRYRRPIMLTETGAEGSARAAWLHYVCDEVREAQASGVPITGICLYPVLDYPGWDNDRHCPVGLYGLPNKDGMRPVYRPLLEEVQRQQVIFELQAKNSLQISASNRRTAEPEVA